MQNLEKILKTKTFFIGIILTLVSVVLVGVLSPQNVSAFPQMGHAFFGAVTTQEGDPVPYDLENPTDPAQTTMVYARNVTRVLDFDADPFSSGEYYGRPVTTDEFGATRYGFTPQALIFPAFDPQDNNVQGAKPGDQIEFYVCAPGRDIPGVLVTDEFGDPIREIFEIGGRTTLDLSADVVPHSFTISGSAGVSGAEMKVGSTVMATADPSGDYSFSVSFGWSGTITPELEGYVFDPASRSYTAVTEDKVNQDYTATVLVTDYTIFFPIFAN